MLILWGISYLFLSAKADRYDMPRVSVKVPNIVSEKPSITWEEEVAYFAEKLISAYSLNSYTAHKYSEWILLASLYSGVPELRLASLIQTESSFRDYATSNIGAIGPTQIRPVFWSDWCLVDIKSPEYNILCGGYILMHYYDLCDQNWSCAYRTYNIGPSNFKRGTKFYIDAGTRYMTKIDTHLNMIREII